jgi:hypothetical protein
MPLRVIESKERLFEALLKRAPLRSLCFLVIVDNRFFNQTIGQSINQHI